MDFLQEKDKIGYYLEPHLKQYIFDELSEGYLKKAGVDDILLNIPIPIKKTELTGMTTLKIAQNMAFVIGCQPEFKYAKNYIDYIVRLYGKRFAEGLINDGIEGAAMKDYDYACIQFRAALEIDRDSTDALYCYGRACKDAYELGEEEDFIARFKAESIEAFEELTLKKPDFDMGYYFLGYGYLNLGLYIKAKLTFEEFMKLSKDDTLKKEIEERLSVLDEPVRIEKGYNSILAGKFEEGITVLSDYKQGPFENWWPLWFYLGTAFMGLGKNEEAIEAFLKVLKISPSNLDTMNNLVILYEEVGDEMKVDKYKNKIKVIQENIEKDKALKSTVS